MSDERSTEVKRRLKRRQQYNVEEESKVGSLNWCPNFLLLLPSIHPFLSFSLPSLQVSIYVDLKDMAVMRDALR